MSLSSSKLPAPARASAVFEHPAAMAFLALVAAASCRTAQPPPPGGISAAEHAATSAALPPGWTAGPAPSGSDWDCANWHLAEWSVGATKDGALEIAPYTKGAADPLPFAIEPEPTALAKKTGFTDLDFAGRRHVLSVSDGLIVGFDKGEFGGRAFWFSKDGRKHYALSPFPEPVSVYDVHPENVQGLVHLGADVLAFEGLAHLGLDEGRVVRIHRGRDGRWRATTFATLPGAPAAIAAESSDRWLVALSKGIVRFYESGRVESVWSERNLGGLYPTSGVRLSDGTTFFGMRHFVLRLRPKGSAYDVDVLVPPGCSGNRCECTN